MINSMAIRNFWEFEQYGCWCIEKKGYGPVRDEIDFACMAHTKVMSAFWNFFIFFYNQEPYRKHFLRNFIFRQKSSLKITRGKNIYLLNFKCWGCARAEHENCDGLATPYRWKFIKDTATNGPVDIKCCKLTKSFFKA